jgi:hypothetical protein
VSHTTQGPESGKASTEPSSSSTRRQSSKSKSKADALAAISGEARAALSAEFGGRQGLHPQEIRASNARSHRAHLRTRAHGRGRCTRIIIDKLGGLSITIPTENAEALARQGARVKELRAASWFISDIAAEVDLTERQVFKILEQRSSRCNIVIPPGLPTVPVDQLARTSATAACTRRAKCARSPTRSSAFGFNAPSASGRASSPPGTAAWKAAKLLGMEEVPYVVLDHLSDEQFAAYCIADNKLHDNSHFDNDILGKSWRELKALNVTSRSSASTRTSCAPRPGPIRREAPAEPAPSSSPTSTSRSPSRSNRGRARRRLPRPRGAPPPHRRQRHPRLAASGRRFLIEGSLFVPYPGPFVPFSETRRETRARHGPARHLHRRAPPRPPRGRPRRRTPSRARSHDPHRRPVVARRDARLLPRLEHLDLALGRRPRSTTTSSSPSTRSRGKGHPSHRGADRRGKRVLIDSGIFWLANQHAQKHNVTMDRRSRSPRRTSTASTTSCSPTAR